MIKYVFVLLILLLFSNMCLSKEILIVTGEYAPLVTSTLPKKGIIAEIVSEAFNRIAGYEVKYEFYPWKRGEAHVASGNAWGTFPYTRTEEREKNFLFSDIIFQSDMVFFYYNQSLDISYDDLVDLKHYSFGGVSGYYYKTAFEEAGLKVLYSSSEELAFKNLVAGRIDFVPIMDIVGWKIVEENYPRLLQNFSILKQPFDVTTSSLMVSRIYPDSKKILEAFNNALDSMKEDGTYQNFLDKINTQYSTVQAVY